MNIPFPADRGLTNRFSTRVTLLACAVASIFLIAASPAGATHLSMTTDTQSAGKRVALTLTTNLTGSGNQTHQYGAKFQLSAGLALWWDSETLGTTTQRCPGSSFSSLNTGITPGAMAFSKTSCPAASRVGTATLGGASGGIYVVGTTPVPSFGVYFDTGVTTPYGRKVALNYVGSVPSLEIYGLENTSSTGLSLNFNNPSRPGLTPKIWTLAESMSSGCTPTSQISATSYTYPDSGTAATTTFLSSVPLNIVGCGIGFNVSTDESTADAFTSLQIDTPLTGSGNDTHQYGAKITLPPSLYVDWWTLGASYQKCSGGTFSSLSTGITPTAKAFSGACPNTAKVGTVTLGSASGLIYAVNTTPLPSFGIRFTSGVATPYGRKVGLNWVDGKPTLNVAGLPNSASSGLSMIFNYPSRSTLPPKIWRFQEPGVPACAPDAANATVFTWPASGSAATETDPDGYWVDVTGC